MSDAWSRHVKVAKALEEAMKACDVEALEQALVEVPDARAFRAYDLTPLLVMAADADADEAIVDKLVAHGADITAPDLNYRHTPLQTAVRLGHHRVLQVLHAWGAPWDFDARTWWNIVVVHRGRGLYALLRELGAPLAEIGAHFLHAGNVSVVQDGVSPDARDPFGWPALVRFVQRGDLEEARDLLDAGADPNLTTPEGTTALAELGRVGGKSKRELRSLADALIERGASLDGVAEQLADPDVDEKAAAMFRELGIEASRPAVAEHLIEIEAGDRRERISFGADAEEWAQLYSSLALLNDGKEPAQERREGKVVGRVRTTKPWSEVVRIVEEEAGLVSGATMRMLRARSR